MEKNWRDNWFWKKLRGRFWLKSQRVSCTRSRTLHTISMTLVITVNRSTSAYDFRSRYSLTFKATVSGTANDLQREFQPRLVLAKTTAHALICWIYKSQKKRCRIKLKSVGPPNLRITGPPLEDWVPPNLWELQNIFVGYYFMFLGVKNPFLALIILYLHV